MHFAVEGAQRVVVIRQEGDEVVQVRPASGRDSLLWFIIQAPNAHHDTFLMGNQPATVEEVRWKQMDIIMALAQAGLSPAIEDSNGDTASDRACRRLEDPFIEGAMLLGTDQK